MTDADLIRSLYVETLARASFDHFCKFSTWDEIDEADRQTWIPNAERAVDALAAAGLLPIAIEDQLAGGFQRGIHTFEDITNQTYPPTYTVRRYVTDWRPTPTTEGDQP